MFKKFCMIFVLLAFTASPAFAAWDITTTMAADSAHYTKFKVVCTSDGNALSATDLYAGFIAQLDSEFVQGMTAMKLKVVPGTGGVIPNTTINITITDEEEHEMWSDTGISKDAITWHSLSDDINMYLPILDKFYLTVNDIGDAGDQVTLYFHCWIE